jgi:hypothetical protein
MKSVLGYTSLSALAVLTLAASPAWASSEAQICIDRPGENGRVNITPVTIVIRGNAELTVLGEQEVCFRPHQDDWSQAFISLKFPFPYSGPSDKRQWLTKPTTVKLRPGATTHLLLCERDQNHNDPQWERNGWHEMWVLLQPKQSRLCAQ